MTFRASSVIPSEKYSRAKLQAVQLKNLAAARSAEFASGATSAQIMSLIDNLKSMRNFLLDYGSVPGIVAYAAEQENDPAYDVAAEFTAMIAAVDAVIVDIVATIPKDGTGYLLVNEIAVDGTLIPRNFTGPQLANIRTLLDAITASIT